jgi:hypothetical protein
MLHTRCVIFTSGGWVFKLKKGSFGKVGQGNGELKKVIEEYYVIFN